MKIDFGAIKDIYPPLLNPINKGPGKLFCLATRKTLDEKQFFKTRRIDKFPNGYLPYCKAEILMAVDDTDPTTFLPILKEIDLPYIPKEWRSLVQKKDRTSGSILGKYVSKMRLGQYKELTWADTERKVKEETEDLLFALRQTVETESEAQEEAEKILSMEDLKKGVVNHAPNGGAMVTGTLQNSTLPVGVDPAALYGLTPETSKYGLTQEEIDNLKKIWGPDYLEDEYFRMEQQLSDLKTTYLIIDPIAVSNARNICKMNLKLNKYLDIDDVESASKMSRQLDLFIKTANLAPVQQKERQQSTFAISQLAYLIEKEGGFIPPWEDYDEDVTDIYDQFLADMQDYTSHLVNGDNTIEENVANLESARRDIQNQTLEVDKEQLKEFEALEKELLEDMYEDEVEDEKEKEKEGEWGKEDWGEEKE